MKMPPVIHAQTKPALLSTGGMVGYQPEKMGLTPAAPAPTRAPAAPPVVRANTKPTPTARDIDQRGRKPLPGAGGRANPLAGAAAGMQSKLAGAAAGMRSKLAGAGGGMQSKLAGPRVLGPRKPGSR